MIRNFLIFTFFLLFNFISWKADSFAFDPLNAEKNIPVNHYNFYGKDQNLLEKSCDIPDLQKENINIYKALNLALCRNPQTKISWYAIKKQAADYGISKSAYLPTFNSGASRARVKNSSNNVSSNNSVTSKNISFEWLLYDFGKRSADKDFQYFALVGAAYKHDDNLQRFIYTTIQAYSNLFSAKEVVKATLRAEESFKTAAEIAQEKYKLGLVAMADVLKAQTNYSQGTLARQKAENNEAVNKGAFLQILNLPQGMELKLDEPSFVNKEYLLEKNILDLIKRAAENRPDLKALIAQEKSLKAASRSALRDNFPKISLYGDKTYSNARSSFNQSGSEVGVKISWPFFTGFQKTYISKKADYDYLSTKEEKEKMQNQLAFDVWKSYQDFKTAKETMITTEELLKSATENKKVALGMYKAGRGAMIDVLIADANYADAEKEKISAKYNNFISEAALLLALGELNSDNLIDTKNNDAKTE